MGVHAKLSASSSSRWINCPPSVKLSENYEDTTSEFAEEGTQAHELCEHKLRISLGIGSEDPTETLSYYNAEMEECATNYVAYIQETLQEVKETCKDPLVLIEQRLDYSKWVQAGFGTGDCVIVADDKIVVIDYKHGMGVEVSATENSQMMCYGLGALALFDGIYDIAEVEMIVYQPRKRNISSYDMSKDELYKWADDVLTPKSIEAYNGEGEFACGSWCKFCKAKYECRKRAEENLKLAQYDFAVADTLEDREVEVILEKVDNMISWANDIKDYALKQALQGKTWGNYKLVEGRATRKYGDESEVVRIVEKAGFNPYESKLLGVTAMTKLLGKTQFEQLIGACIIKPKGKPTLVPMSDKRKPINKTDEAISDFKGE